MDQPIETIKYKGHEIEIHYDESGPNPATEWDWLGTMVCRHSRYDLGHVQLRESPEDWLQAKMGVDDPEDYDGLMALFQKDHLVLPLYLYDHGGITIRTGPFGDPWDSGQVGFIYVSHESVRKEFGRGKQAMKKADACLQAEVRTYDEYLRGEVYGYIVKTPDGLRDDSCWGFYGDDGKKEAIAQAKSAVNWNVKKERAERDALNQRLVIAAALGE